MWRRDEWDIQKDEDGIIVRATALHISFTMNVINEDYKLQVRLKRVTHIFYIIHNLIVYAGQANDFLTVSVRLVGGNLISDCPKCDHRAGIGAKRSSDLEQALPSNCTVPVASLCPHERMAVLLVLAQEAKLEGRVPDFGVLI